MDERAPLERLKSILEGAVALDGDSRAAFLDRECGDDSALRGKAEQFLAAHDAASGFLGPTSSDTADVAKLPFEVQSRGRIGPYALLALLGEGGFGVVYLAEQTEPLRRRVALKLLRVGSTGSQVLAR